MQVENYEKIIINYRSSHSKQGKKEGDVYYGRMPSELETFNIGKRKWKWI